MSTVTIMIRLGEGFWVNALDIASVQSNYDRNYVVVRLRDGKERSVVPDYKQSVFDLEKRILDHVNEAARIYSGKVEHAEPQFKPAGL